MKRNSEIVKFDNALNSQSLNGEGIGEYFQMKTYRRATVVVGVGAMALGATSAIQMMQAQNSAGLNAKVITNNTATITANTKVSSAKFTAAAAAAADMVKVNGLTFTAVANGAAADKTKRQFAVGAGGTADADTATALAAIINDPDYGAPGIKAVAAAAVVTLTCTEPGETEITVEGTAVRLVAATVNALAYIECDSTHLDVNNGFTHVAVKITNSAAIQTAAKLIRGDGRYSVEQHVAASKSDVSA